jgi:tetratricopeptide (TPR) repeat protein
LSCSSEKPKDTTTTGHAVVVGLDGKEYFAPQHPTEAQAKLDSAAKSAFAKLQSDSSEDNFVWCGRREAYRYNYKNAIEIFTSGLEKFPESYKLLRHRGHRYITIRDFDKAIIDLEKAAGMMPADPLEIEPDGLPNKLNIPLSTTQFNILYHLGLAHYLKGDFVKAEDAYRKCLQVSTNDDLLCATTDWLYMTYRRAGKTSDAEKLLELIHEDMKIIENHSYYKRLMMYKGRMKPDELLQVDKDNEDPDLTIATQGYGVGNWYLYNGDSLKAAEVLRQVTAGNNFAAFGFIAAEADLLTLR